MNSIQTSLANLIRAAAQNRINSDLSSTDDGNYQPNLNLLNNNNSNIKSFHSEKTKNGIKHITFNNSGTQFAYSSRDGNCLFIYDLSNFKQIKQIDFKTQINEFDFNKTDTKLFITDDNGHINILNTSNYDEMNMIEGHFFPINCINISKSNKNFITGGLDSLIVMYDMNELMSIKVFKRSEQCIKKCQFSYDEKFIASIYEGTNVDFFSVELGCPIFTIFTDNTEYCIKWNNKNNILAYSGDDKNNHGGEDGNVHLIEIS
jgi:WD40 repeat protein